jgi:DNA-binding GntR family transcriptional regulator
VRYRIIDVTDDEVNDRLATALGIAAASGPVTHVMSVMDVDGLPAGIRDSYLSPLIRDSLLAYLESPPDGTAPLELPGGLTLHGAEAELELSSASPFESEQLGIGASAPTILGTYRDFGASPATGVVPVEFARLVYRTDITVFRLALR